MPTYLEMIIRAVAIFFILFILARILGKKQISQLTFFDYVTGIAIGSMAASVAIRQDQSFLYGFIGLSVFTGLSLLFSFLSLKSLTMRDLIEGNPTVLVQNGEVLEDNLKKVRLTHADLMMGLRRQNVFKLSDVETAILETNGRISVMKKSQNQPLTPKDIGLSVLEESSPSLVIVDGHVLEKRLSYLGYTKEWLKGEVMKQGASEFEDVFLAQIDSQGNVYVDLRKDQNRSEKVPQKPLLAAQLRKVQADLEMFALQTNDQNAKQMYYNQSKELDKVIQMVNPYMKQ
ncbi:uncharacterized membrane protein YcaP (DUF421 family) [Melghiribacillus thermohalophilus]|uniref:Uncharacterized membrane protein YcaP (DUF421 family) n=1 Tax=Melghiribacillus thermohalophilus TaxID=1324956 RepID=A0A4R3MWT0_9BACI|nr:DUF421 domain-containing protein [Melghiribacillus thermohalophilus]TCT19976.1 uncharacterized membrane protein YcaP (DUF421 family) [Melghiribacillus thermohalophilus]